MKNTLLFISLFTVACASHAAGIAMKDQPEVDQMKAAAIQEATKHLLSVSDPTYSEKNQSRAAIRVEVNNNGSKNYCLVLVSKLMVPGSDKGIWVAEKSECK